MTQMNPNFWTKLGLAIAMIGTSNASLQSQESSTALDDPFAWLEDVTGDASLAWVRARNQVSHTKIESDPQFAKLESELLAILDSDARIPTVSKHGSYFYNFWRDKKNPRGLWRRTTLEEYVKNEIRWEILLDLDELGKAENESWVWGSAQLLRPDYKRCLLAMSRGGADAKVYREFDLESKAFVEGGFVLPEAKGSMMWIDRDHVFVQTKFSEDAMTDSGYPRIAKIWTRGTKLEEAKVVYEGIATDMSISAVHDDSPGFERNFVHRNIAFYQDELFQLKDEGTLAKIDAPNSANKSVFREYLVFETREPWEIGNRKLPAGALALARFDDYMAGKREVEVVFEPTEKTALASYGFTKDYLFLNILEDVKNRIYVIALNDPNRTKVPLQGAPRFGTLSISAVDPDESNDYFLTAADYLTPTTLSMGVIGKEPKKLKSLPAFFDASGLEISQHFAISKDGTRVPYFMVAKKGLALNGENPTLLYGYGGFEISMQPSYSAGVGVAWTTQGGVYVVANIRGGGEYGPRWHQAALRANRLRAYEDFAAVALDLMERKVTNRQKLGIQGGSNGGLLVGNMVTLYPKLMSAAVCQVPLLDMKRYNHLLAGASWMAEYGNPDKPEEWEFIKTFSPYHNVRKDEQYPSVLFTTSTRDDRVHPGHARKMMAKMESLGHDVLYYENIEGGHGGAANNSQLAHMQAMAYTFLKQKLFDPQK